MKEKVISKTMLYGAMLLSMAAVVSPVPALANTVIAQNHSSLIKAKGIVEDENGPVVGASVIQKGATNGTTTDIDGQFSLSVAEGATLVISYVGCKTVEVKASTEPIKVNLVQDSQLLNEVVVTALGIKRDRKALGYGLDEVKG